jgi:hypothetical protein
VFDARRRIGGVSYVAAKYGTEEDSAPMQVNDVKRIIAYVNDSVAVNLSSGSSPPVQLRPTPSVKRLLQKLVPYSKDLPGSPTYFAWERKKLLSMLTSNVVLSEGSWRWFLTSSPAEVYDPYLYKIVAEHDDPQQDVILSKSKRLEILRSHPALSCRLFDIKQDILWENVIMGKHNPLGKVTDYWRRTEFQFKGSPHEHCLVAVAKDGILPEDVCSVDEARTDVVKDVVKRTVTCSLKIAGSIDDVMRNNTEGIEKDGDGDEGDERYVDGCLSCGIEGHIYVQ